MHPGSGGGGGGGGGGGSGRQVRGYRSSLRPLNNRQSEANKEEEAVDALAAQAETQTATLQGTVAVPVVGQPTNQAGKRANQTMRTCSAGSWRIWENSALGEGPM